MFFAFLVKCDSQSLFNIFYKDQKCSFVANLMDQNCSKVYLRTISNVPVCLRDHVYHFLGIRRFLLRNSNKKSSFVSSLLCRL